MFEFTLVRYWIGHRAGSWICLPHCGIDANDPRTPHMVTEFHVKSLVEAKVIIESNGLRCGDYLVIVQSPSHVDYVITSESDWITAILIS
jgi:hypothetical protein